MTELAEKLFHRHMMHYNQGGRRIVGSFEAIPGFDHGEAETAYAELVTAGLMHPGRPAGPDDPGTYLLSPRAAQVECPDL